MERTCKKCGETKPIEEFVKDVTGCKFGFSHLCKTCFNIKRKGRRNHEHDKVYRKNNLEKRNEYNKKWYKDNPNKSKKYAKNRADNITDIYIAHIIKNSTGLNPNIIRQNPELIENYRMQIKLKRLINQEKNGNKNL